MSHNFAETFKSGKQSAMLWKPMADKSREVKSTWRISQKTSQWRGFASHISVFGFEWDVME
jgi:hypothetical protein